MIRNRTTVLSLLVGGFLLFDLFFLRCVRIPSFTFDLWWIVASTAAGLLVAQFYLLALWGAWGPGPPLLRLASMGLLATLVWLAVSVGGWFEYRSSLRFSEMGITILAGVVWPYVPLLVLHFVTGRQFAYGDTPPRRQHSLAQLMLTVTLFAVTLGIFRLVVSPEEISQIPAAFLSVLISSAMAAANLLAVAPSIFPPFAEALRRKRLLLFWLAVLPGVVGLELTLMLLLSRRLPSVHDLVVLTLMLLTFNLAQSLGVLLSLAAVSATGLRLMRVARTNSQADTAAATPPIS